MDAKKQYDLLIIGGGPCALSAAIYASRACLKVAYIEKCLPGGKMNKTSIIENYPGIHTNGPELADMMKGQVDENKVVCIYDEVIEVQQEGKDWILKTRSGKVMSSKTVLISTGMKEKKLNIPNEHGYVSYCAICDGNFYKNQEVIVVGGGNSAADESLYLAQIASKVKIIHRRNEFRAEKGLVKKMIEHPKIEIYTPFFPKEVIVENNNIKALRVIHAVNRTEMDIEAQGIFFYIGLLPENEFLQQLKLEKDEYGFLIVDPHMRTSLPGLYAAGDVIKKELRQIVTAVNDGAIAAIDINNYLKNEY